MLLVEDQVEVRRVAGQILERYGDSVVEAASPAAALSICQQREPRIDLLLTDVVIPHMNGRELAQRAVRLRPAMRVLYMSWRAGCASCWTAERASSCTDSPRTRQIPRKVAPRASENA